MEYDLSRFAIAHQRDYQQALAEIKMEESSPTGCGIFSLS